MIVVDEERSSIGQEMYKADTHVNFTCVNFSTEVWSVKYVHEFTASPNLLLFKMKKRSKLLVLAVRRTQPVRTFGDTGA
jgi:hypothetical protein